MFNEDDFHSKRKKNSGRNNEEKKAPCGMGSFSFVSQLQGTRPCLRFNSSWSFKQKKQIQNLEDHWVKWTKNAPSYISYQIETCINYKIQILQKQYSNLPHPTLVQNTNKPNVKQN